MFLHSVEECDVARLLSGKTLLGKGMITRITLKFVVEGQFSGNYSAVIANYDDGFYLDAVYRVTPVENKTRLSVAMPGRY